MIEHRLIARCDWPGCTASVLSGRLHFHGTAGDSAELGRQVAAMGWALALLPRTST